MCKSLHSGTKYGSVRDTHTPRRRDPHRSNGDLCRSTVFHTAGRNPHQPPSLEDELAHHPPIGTDQAVHCLGGHLDTQETSNFILRRPTIRPSVFDKGRRYQNSDLSAHSDPECKSLGLRGGGGLTYTLNDPVKDRQRIPVSKTGGLESCSPLYEIEPSPPGGSSGPSATTDPEVDRLGDELR